MSDTFDIPVTYQGRDLEFKAKLWRLGYTHKFEVDVHGISVIFEPDEERNYRAIFEKQENVDNRKIGVELLSSIAHTLEEIMK
ncbi:MAG: hypothetical protein ABJA57_12025 [Ginsengibacter sp.]